MRERFARIYPKQRDVPLKYYNQHDISMVIISRGDIGTAVYGDPAPHFPSPSTHVPQSSKISKSHFCASLREGVQHA
jgi:hypothetical protein